jgi:PAS domain S-box-containing protein
MTASRITPPPILRLVRVAALAAIYFGLGKAGLAFAAAGAPVSPIWPPTGLAVAALIFYGPGLWPGVAAGAWLLAMTVSGDPLVSFAIGAGNTIEALLAALIVGRMTQGYGFERARDAFLFAVGAGVLAPIPAATLGVGAFTAAGLVRPADTGSMWVTWFLADALASVIYAPALLLLWTDRRRRTAAEIVEAVVVLVALTALALTIFGRDNSAGHGVYPVAFLCVPLALWPAFRLGQLETAWTAVLLSGVAIWGTFIHHGPFGLGSLDRGLLQAQAFGGVVAVTSAAMAALVSERRRLYAHLEARVRERTEQLRLANEELHVEIAARERVQAALRSSEGRLLEAQALAHVGSWEWDIERNVHTWSDEVYRIYGVDRDTFVVRYRHFISMVHPDDRADLDIAVRQAMATGGVFEIEHRIIRPDGSERTITARGRTVCDGEGRPVRMLGTTQDITERKRAEEQHRELIEAQAARRQAESASRMKDEFLAIVSHELRTPLNAILGWSQMLAAGSLDEAGAAKALKIIDRNAFMQARLIDDLLDVSRFATGQAVVHAGPVAIGAVVSTALEAIEPSASARGIRVELSAADSVSMVYGDPERLQQVVSNLLSNAVKFTPEGGSVRIGVEERMGNVQIWVADTGRGIAPHDLPRVFEPFWQVDTTLTRTDSGLGLGLAIVRSLVEAHGGTVRAESDGLGCGARFTVELPRAGAAT